MSDDVDAVLIDGWFSESFGDMDRVELTSQGATLLAMVTYFAGLAEALSSFTKVIPEAVSELFTRVSQDPSFMDKDPVEMLDSCGPLLGKACFGGVAMLHEMIMMMRKVFHHESELVEDAFSMEPFLTKYLTSEGLGTEDEMRESVCGLLADFHTVQAQEVACGEE